MERRTKERRKPAKTAKKVMHERRSGKDRRRNRDRRKEDPPERKAWKL